MNVLKSCAAALLAITSLASIEAARCVPDKALEANEALAGDALDAFFNKRDVSAVDKYIGVEYLQHNPGVKDGPGELKSFIEMFPSDSKFELGTTAAEGDLVWTHARYTGIPGANVSVIVDIFRVKDGLIVEHWDVIQQEVPASETASGRPMFPITASTPTPVAKSCGETPGVPCETQEQLDANKVLAATALDAFFNKRDVSAVDKYIGAEYLQHNPGVKDGPGELKSFIEMFPSDSKFELGTQVAQGDLVWTHGRYTGIPGLNPMIIVDIFRVKDGKLVEHWDIAQEEVTQTASGRPMFPIGA
jgi:predicted SnoaL-like aldol condensation-catalyzing enzyme|uniref:SnoaL-like domain-containing protein n=1 Tax=Globisporangium ultimum (strain ATCC 200006 / CBS 805.95 / DAOM BR144) TaxID=431595 RepID=K3WWA7_GLOUD